MKTMLLLLLLLRLAICQQVLPTASSTLIMITAFARVFR
jgi:hypothetical protein